MSVVRSRSLGAGSGSLARLRDAATGFVQAWRSRRPPPRATELREFQALLALALCGAVVVVGWAGDGAIAARVAGLPLGAIRVFAAITRLGTSGYIFALTVIVALAAVLARGRGQGRRIDAGLTHLAARTTYIFAVVAVSGIASQVLKHLFGRARPKLMHLVGPFHFDMFAIKATFASFPSGHTVTVFATAMALGYFVPRWRFPLFALALAVAVSRVAIGSHYPSDVVAGAAIGVASAVLIRRSFAARRIAFRKSPRGIAVRGRGLVRAALAAMAGRKAAA
jgi:membrane-associated phospholipid phosphatase